MRRFLIGCSLALLVPALRVNAEDLESPPMDSPIDTAIAPSTATLVAEEPFVFPLEGSKPRVVSGFGHRDLGKLARATHIAKLPDAERHEGVDFAAQPGKVVVAAKSGKVIFAGFSTAYVTRKNKKEKNRFVIVQHTDGTSTRYVHLNSIKVRPQQVVAAGEELGTTAESDEWLQPVLHFEIRDAGGKPQNPMKYLGKNP